MAEITTRSSNRAELTHKQVDTNFINLNSAVMKAQLDSEEAKAIASSTPSIKETTGRVRIAPNAESDNGSQTLQVYGSAFTTSTSYFGGMPGFESFRILPSQSGSVSGGRLDVTGGTNAALFPRVQVVNTSTPDCSLSFGTQGTGSFRFFSHGVGGIEQMRVTGVANAASYLNMYGAITSYPAIYTVGGQQSNIPVALASKGNASVQLQTGGGFVQFSAFGDPGVTCSIQASGGTGTVAPAFTVIGSGVSDLRLIPKSGGRVRFGTFTASADIPVVGFITMRDDGGTDRRIAIV